MTEDVPTEQVRGPFLDELSVGQTFAEAPAVTLTEGMAATHRSLIGNRLRITLDEQLAEAVTGSRRPAPPALVWDTSIGQSTVVTQYVRANLFYRGLCLRRHPEIGDTLSTVTTVDALRTNSARPGRPPTGLAVLHIQTTDQHARPVLDFWRCAMLPMSSAAATTDHQDDVDEVGRAPREDELGAAVHDWDLDHYRRHVPGPHLSDIRVGKSWAVLGRDVVTGAPELARLTGNVAAVHHDATAAGGHRLVYGGHTIGLALHQVTRALPSLVTITGWEGCDHLAPVCEDEVLESVVSVTGILPRPTGGGLVRLRVLTTTTREDGSSEAVLDWRFTGVLA